jgi:hypothetical protein
MYPGVHHMLGFSSPAVVGAAAPADHQFMSYYNWASAGYVCPTASGATATLSHILSPPPPPASEHFMSL